MNGIIASLLLSAVAGAAEPADAVWLEAEQFASTGGWQRDTQHVDIMGSVYLLATGLGRPVEDAVTQAKIPEAGSYRLWVRCRDWLPSHSPGRFQVLVGGRASAELGRAADDAWRWQDAGRFELEAGEVEVRIRDLSGWWGRVDAVVLARDGFAPADDLQRLAEQRLRYGGVSAELQDAGEFHVVVVGAGPAGLGAAVAAARHGARVALLQDRPVVGGNSSSEIQVPPMGYTGNPPDRVNVTGLCEEFFPPQGPNGYADSSAMEAVVRAEPNITLFLNTRATGVLMKGAAARPLEPGEEGQPGEIEAVIAIDVLTGGRTLFRAPIFIDCTGHAWVGYWAGAEYRMGQEPRDEFDESLAPAVAVAAARTQGNSLYNSVIVTRDQPVAFEAPPWAYLWQQDADFQPRGDHRRLAEIRRPENFDRPARGKGRNPGDNPDGAIVRSWWVEYGGMLDTVRAAERIRDELLRIHLGLWNYAKNHNPNTRQANERRELVWLNYVPGVRESRRLMGPYVMRQSDFDRQVVHEDTIAFSDWGPDIHHPEGFWVAGNDCIHVYHGRRTSIPYRTLYSRNIVNLMMAGRCHSATQIAMGGTRVMRPCMAMGQAAGTAAAIAVAHGTTPAGVHQQHLQTLQQMLLKDGCYLLGVTNADPGDLARSATITASSSAAGLPAENVANGWNRIVDGQRNAWLADGRGPQWIALRLDRPRPVNVAHVTFEGRSVSVRVEAWCDGRWQTIGRIARGGGRRCLVPLEPTTTEQVRLVLPGPAAICEIRLYDEPQEEVEAIRRRQATATRAIDIVRPDLPGVFLDDTEAEPAGHWAESTYHQPFFGSGYLHDDNGDKGDKSLVFYPELAGRYELRLAYVPGANRASNVPVTIVHAGGETVLQVDQRPTPPLDGRFVSLGTFVLNAESAIRVDTTATDGYVVVDGLHLVPR